MHIFLALLLCLRVLVEYILSVVFKSKNNQSQQFEIKFRLWLNESPRISARLDLVMKSESTAIANFSKCYRGGMVPKQCSSAYFLSFMQSIPLGILNG